MLNKLLLIDNLGRAQRYLSPAQHELREESVLDTALAPQSEDVRSCPGSATEKALSETRHFTFLVSLK